MNKFGLGKKRMFLSIKVERLWNSLPIRTVGTQNLTAFMMVLNNFMKGIISHGVCIKHSLGRETWVLSPTPMPAFYIKQTFDKIYKQSLEQGSKGNFSPRQVP